MSQSEIMNKPKDRKMKDSQKSTKDEVASAVDAIVMRSDDAEYMTLRAPVNIHWNPKKDITTYELAEAMGILLYMTSGGNTWEAEQHIKACDKSVQRHFNIKPNA